MTDLGNKITISDENIQNKIYVIRGEKVMIDSDLAQLYGVETKALKQAVRRNIDIFPENFMFELTKQEFGNLRSQNVTSSWGGQRYLPFVFTEHGVLQLANVLRSPLARRMSVRIINVFIRMRETLNHQKNLQRKLEELEKCYIEHDDKLSIIFEYLKQLETVEQQRKLQVNRQKIGYKISGKK